MKYTPAQTLELADAYLAIKDASDVLQQLSEQFSVPERSIIAKLSSLGIYQKKSYTTKRGDAPVRKEEYVARIAMSMNIDVDLLDSLEKANKNVLILLLDALNHD